MSTSLRKCDTSLRAKVEDYLSILEEKDITVADTDFSRPWGGFILLEEKKAAVFAHVFFSGMVLDKSIFSRKLSPKLIFVHPQARLSWQYHHRRSEIWQVLEGPVGIVRSETDEETPMKTYRKGERVELAQGERHRLVGLENMGVVAELWQHTNPENPSSEEDIIRVQDDFKRT